MFRKNERHLQPALISNVSELPAKQRQHLEESWAGTFRREFFGRLKEEAFAVLYSDVPSRPNVPVNVLVSLDTLKAGYGWSDEELHDHFLYDLQVRYAVGDESLAEGDFELRTLYNFRRRLSQYNLAHGTNLLETAFADITDQQITALAVKTGQQRMDSTQIASNIVVMSRLQLTVEAIQRLHRLLSEADRRRYAELLEPYIGETAGHYVHRVKGRAATDANLQLTGQVLYQLLQAMADGYGQEPAYQVAARLFGEQYRVQAETAQPKANSEISPSSLQSLDDLEATYREKNRVGYKGYVANMTETCDPANPLQLITAVQVAPNTAEDGELLAAVLPSLKQRTGLDTLYTDGAYGGPLSDPALREQQVTLTQTAMIGSEPAPEWLHLADFAITQDAQGRPLTLTCPQGQTVPITPSGKPHRFAVNLAGPACATCPLYQAGRCPPQPDKHYRTFRLTFTRTAIDSAQRRRRSRALRATGHNPRAAVESTIRSVKHPFPAGKLPVRGLFRTTCLIVASAAMTNVRRIQRYLQGTRPQGPQRPETRDQLPFNPVTNLLAGSAAAFVAVLESASLPLPIHRPRTAS